MLLLIHYFPKIAREFSKHIVILDFTQERLLLEMKYLDNEVWLIRGFLA